MRTFLGWFFLAYYALNALTSILLIDKDRKPVTPGVAAVCAVIYGLLAWGIYVLWAP